MSQDKDIIFQLVTSKYKIADRNRRAKNRFLSSDLKRRGSEPTEKCEDIAPKKLDLSLPGTPVNSRYLSSLQNNKKSVDSESEDEDRDELIKQNTIGFLDESFRKFTSNMLSLQDQPINMDINFAETTKQTKPVKVTSTQKNLKVEAVELPLSDDKIELKPIVVSSKQFDSSTNLKNEILTENKDDFKVKNNEEERVSSSIQNENKTEVDGVVKTEAVEVVKKYFNESTRRGSYQRDFSEIVETYEPKPKVNDEKDSGIDLLIPGVPVSSKKLFGFSFGRKKKKAIKLEALPKPDIKIANKKDKGKDIKVVDSKKEKEEAQKPAEPVAEEKIIPIVSKKVNEVHKEPTKVDDSKHYARQQSAEDMANYFIQSGRRSSYQYDIADQLKGLVTSEANQEPPKVDKAKHYTRRQSVEEMENYFIQSGRRNSFQNDIADQLKGLKSKTAFAMKKQKSLDLSVPGTTVSSKHLILRSQKSENSDNEKKVTLSSADNDNNSIDEKELQQLSDAIDSYVLHGEDFGLKNKKPSIKEPSSKPKTGIIKQVKLRLSNFKAGKNSKTEAKNGDIPKQNGTAHQENGIAKQETSVVQKNGDLTSSVGKPLLQTEKSVPIEIPQNVEKTISETEDLNEKSLKIKNIDLTVPGVTISSAYIQSLLIETDNQCNEDVTKTQEHSNELLDAEIKIFVEKTFESNKSEILFSPTEGNSENENEKLLTEALINEVIHELNVEKSIDPKQNNMLQTEDKKNDIEFEELKSPKLLLETIQSNYSNDDDSVKTEDKIPDIEDLTLKPNKVEKYFEEIDGKNSFQRTFSKVQEFNDEKSQTNHQIDKYFEESEGKRSFARSFTEVMSFAETIQNIVKSSDAETTNSKELESNVKQDEIADDRDIKEKNQISRTSSLSSINSSISNSDVIHPPRKHGKKKYGVDKYFATSLYKSAHQRSPSLRSFEDQTGEDVTAEEIKKANVQEAIDILNDLETLNDDIENDPYLKAEFWRNYLK